MSEVIIAALIGAFATIVAAIFVRKNGDFQRKENEGNGPTQGIAQEREFRHDPQLTRIKENGPTSQPAPLPSNQFGVNGAAGYVIGQLDGLPRTEQDLIRLAQERSPEGLKGTRYADDDTVECPRLRQLADHGAVSCDGRRQIIVERGHIRRCDRYHLAPVTPMTAIVGPEVGHPPAPTSEDRHLEDELLRQQVDHDIQQELLKELSKAQGRGQDNDIPDYTP